MEAPGLVFYKHPSESQQCKQNLTVPTPECLGVPELLRCPGCGPCPAFSTGIDHMVRTCPVPASINGHTQGINFLLLIKYSSSLTKVEVFQSFFNLTTVHFLNMSWVIIISSPSLTCGYMDGSGSSNNPQVMLILTE